MFCSVDCRNETYRIHGDELNGMLFPDDDLRMLNFDRFIRELEDAFGGHKALLKFFKKNDINKLKKTIFDYDWREDEKKKRIIGCISSDSTHKTFSTYNITLPSYKLTRGHPEFANLGEKLVQLFKIYVIRELNIKGSEQYDERIGISMSHACIRPSCMPNVAVKVIDNKVCTFAMSPIKSGQEIFLAKT